MRLFTKVFTIIASISMRAFAITIITATYNINNILLSYGFDKAFKYYIDNNYDTQGSSGSQGGRQLSDIKNVHSITKTLVYYLIVSSFEIR